ncbi:gamma-glutamylcyclotransferase [Verticiella sediminum]|uniref:Putative gamma-glutamylcyclotransferase n=1 Tax=Verticiella sediminum TaxID=1247510 RepID=A0A556AGX7_9BURK|nr:gamma-glutamylcyclotransferase family protein [Verticiella sediminum]TSH92147.1 gamma-glutamylcyclotransferase [Verticiella sediminum]
MSVHVFAYGVLAFDDIVQAITGHIYDTEDAVLPDFRRYGLPHPGGKTYAAIDAHPGHDVQGRLIRNVTLQDLELFDRVEELKTGYYVRQRVRVRVADQDCDAYAYLVGPTRRHTLAGDWVPAAFGPEEVQTFIDQDLPRILHPFPC